MNIAALWASGALTTLLATLVLPSYRNRVADEVSGAVAHAAAGSCAAIYRIKIAFEKHIATAQAACPNLVACRRPRQTHSPIAPRGIDGAAVMDHVVGYENKDPAVMSHLPTGYPRFIYHPLVREAGVKLSPEGTCLPFPSLKCAEACAEFVRRNHAAARVVSREGLFGTVTGSGARADALKAFWQHTGLIVSSRQAMAWMSGRSESPSGGETRRALRDRLAGFYDCSPDDIFLCPTGMAAHYAALRILQVRSPGLPTVQLGFPYVDTLKLQQKFGAGGILLHDLESLGDDLRRVLHSQKVAGGFCEIPGNPLLGSADLALIGPQLRAKGIPLVVDDVVATHSISTRTVTPTLWQPASPNLSPATAR